jgi:hypothetical protein
VSLVRLDWFSVFILTPFASVSYAVVQGTLTDASIAIRYRGWRHIEDIRHIALHAITEYDMKRGAFQDITFRVNHVRHVSFTP